MSSLTFLGAAGEVTGSCYLFDTGTVKFLVDCGMFQGGRDGRRKNRRFSFDPREIAFVLLSHAHIDHSGLLPRLAAQLGRRIVDGAKSVRIYKENYPVCARIFTINGLSAHADRDALLGWIGGFRKPPRQTWVVHGEPLSAHALKDEIVKRWRWNVGVPAIGERATL